MGRRTVDRVCFGTCFGRMDSGLVKCKVAEDIRSLLDWPLSDSNIFNMIDFHGCEFLDKFK